MPGRCESAAPRQTHPGNGSRAARQGAFRVTKARFNLLSHTVAGRGTGEVATFASHLGAGHRQPKGATCVCVVVCGCVKPGCFRCGLTVASETAKNNADDAGRAHTTFVCPFGTKHLYGCRVAPRQAVAERERETGGRGGEWLRSKECATVQAKTNRETPF